MMYADVQRLLGLGAVILCATGGVWLLLRTGARTGRGEIVLGYPLDLFPAIHLTRAGPLRALAVTQARLVSMYRHMPPAGDTTIWLRTFLYELREIMDTAYRVAVVTEAYGRQAPLERLLEEVQQIEMQLAEQVARQLLRRDGDTEQELLAGRLATLQMCVRELTLLSAMPPTAST